MSNRKLRIKHLSQEITRLTQELDSLLIEELSAQPSAEPNTGDIVTITNNHRGLKGKKGTVIKVSSKQVTIRLQDGRIVQRSKTNVCKQQDDRPSHSGR
jgi:hypothetical protein